MKISTNFLIKKTRQIEGGSALLSGNVNKLWRIFSPLMQLLKIDFFSLSSCLKLVGTPGMYIMDKCQNVWESGDQLKSLFEFMIKHKSWWDTVDFISSSLVNYWWKMDPELLDKSVTPEWNKSDNFWLNRTSIIYQLRRKDLTNERILSQHIIPHSNSNEFFVQKAIGWALREYAKINSKWVLDFVATHQLKPLSKREALKQIKAGKIKRPW